VRAIRDARSPSIRNLLAALPDPLPSAFAEQMPTLRELRQLAEAGELRGAPALWFRRERPTEALCDTDADPHQIRDLASDPRHADVLARMRRALDARLAQTRDRGLESEAALRAEFWPAGEQPVTAVPAIGIAARGADRWGRDASAGRRCLDRRSHR
jgi:hypothetical protein